MKKSNNEVKSILIVLALISIGAVYYYLSTKKRAQEPIELPQPPNIEKILSDTTNHLRETFEEERQVWKKQVQDLTEMNSKKDADISRLRATRKATNKNVTDSELMGSVNSTIVKLQILGYE